MLRQVSTLPLALFTRPPRVLLSKETLKVCQLARVMIALAEFVFDLSRQECVAFATQTLLASMPNARASKAHESYYGHVIVSGRCIRSAGFVHQLFAYSCLQRLRLLLAGQQGAEELPPRPRLVTYCWH